MAAQERSISFLVSTAFPNAYFLDEGLWQASAEPEHLNSLSRLAGLESEARVRRYVWDAIVTRWRQHNSNLDRNDPEPIAVNATFELVNYNRVKVKIGYDTFICTRPDCERVFTRNQVAPTYKCQFHPDENVAQLAHLFVHNVCGSVALISPRICRNEIDNQRCNTALRLHLEYQQMGKSYWWCPACKARGLPRNSDNEQPGWSFGLMRRCDTCSVDGQPPVWMALTTARTVYKPQRVDLIDMPQADHTLLLQEWFSGETVSDEVIEQQLPPPLRKSFRTNPKQHQQIINMYREQNLQDIQLPEIEPTVREELCDFAGARDAVIREMTDSLSSTGLDLQENYGLRTSLLDNLAVVRATYGYLIGGTDPSEAALRVFPMGGSRYAVLTQRNQTEALLFELLPNHVLQWLHSQDLALEIYDEMNLRRYLITSQADSSIVEKVKALVHTLSHALRRSSERYTGVGSEAIDEILFPRCLALVLYNNRGSELGMFTTTFEGRMREWLAGTRYDMLNCPLDPMCMRDSVAACPGCLYVGERGCTTLWNRALDRRYLVNLPTSEHLGYWTLEV